MKSEGLHVLLSVILQYLLILVWDGPFDIRGGGGGWVFFLRQVIFFSLFAQQVIFYSLFAQQVIFFKSKLQQVFICLKK